MALNSGMVTTYTNTQAQRRVVTDRILLASPYDIAAIQALGLENTSKFRFVNTPGVTYTWLEDTYLPRTDTIDNGFASSTTTTTATPTNISLYQPGDVIKIDNEYMWVSSTNSGTYLTVTRGFGGTTPTTHASASTITLLYSARLEGATADDSPTTIITTNYNYSTILQYTVNVSRSDSRLKQYGMSDLKEYYIDKGMDELMEKLNRLTYYGVRSQGSASSARSSGGLKQFISTNITNASGDALTRKHIDDMLESTYRYGGQPDLILCSTWARRKINSFYEPFITTNRDEKVGGMRIDLLEHPFGGKPIKIIADRHCQSDHLYMIDTRYAGYITIDAFFYEDLAKDGDYEKGEIVGEYGFVVQFEKAHGYIYGFSTSA